MSRGRWQQSIGGSPTPDPAVRLAYAVISRPLGLLPPTGRLPGIPLVGRRAGGEPRFQLLCVLTHVARMIDPGVRGWAYATGQVIFTQLLLISIGVGVVNTWRARRRGQAAEQMAARS